MSDRPDPSRPVAGAETGQAPYGDQPPYGNPPPYANQPPYAQPPYSQTPYGQLPDGNQQPSGPPPTWAIGTGPPPPKRPGRMRWIVVGVIAVVFGVGAISVLLRQQAYDRGHAAYLQGDCAAAVGPLRDAAGTGSNAGNETEQKARSELQECEALFAAEDLDTQGKQADAVLAYSDIVTRYPRSPVKDKALEGGQRLVGATPPARLATAPFCRAIETLESQRFVEGASVLPPLLFECGRALASTGAFAEALIALDRFRAEFPAHDLRIQVDEAYASAVLAEAAAAGAAPLPQPDTVGPSAGSANSVSLVIRNDSPEHLTIVFSGPEVHVEQLPACPECQEFAGQAPEACPDKGPIGRYEVAPGEYSVVVKATAGDRITPFRGTWNLEAGTEYSECYYIVTESQ